MRIVFFTHYFPPEGNAPASRTFDHCSRWVKAGHDVTVITCQPNVPNGVVYDGFRNHLWPQRSEMEGVRVVRVWTYVAPNAGGLKRILNYLSYVFSALFAFMFFCRRPNVIVATSPQFFCGWTGTLASLLTWNRFVLEIRDIWPESITTVGAMKKGLAVRCLEVMEKWMYQSANHIVAVGHGYKDNIAGKLGRADSISVVTNGVDPQLFSPRASSPSFRKEFGLDSKFVCSYVGTIGMAHGMEVVLRAARILRKLNRSDICFCLIGDGAMREQLQQQCDADDLQPWVKFTGRLDKQRMPEATASSDCLLIHLKKCDLFETVIPSKIFEAMAMERPLIMGVKGEAAEIVARSGAGLAMEPDSESDLVAACVRLKDEPGLMSQLQRSGRDFVVANYSRDVLAQKMLDILIDVAS